MMQDWMAFPFKDVRYDHDTEALRANWRRLHACDAEPLPADPALLQAWRHFHAGDFAQATHLGLQAGPAGLAVASRAQCIYAHYLEPHEPTKLRLFMDVVERCEAHCAVEGNLAQAWFSLAYALARLVQAVNVTEAYAGGIAPRIRHALDRTLQLAPEHADAHVAMGVFHAELIDKLGLRLALAQGASPEACLGSFERALALNPASPVARLEQAQALLVVHGESEWDAAERLYLEAAHCVPMDATERLQVESALTALSD